MKTIIETIVDKSQWLVGPWQQEPDKKQWLDEATGLPCLIVRQGEFGHLCGYVGVYKGHPWFEKGYDDVPANVHGGLTYANHCADHICHVVEEGEDDNVWWLGFDCAHCDDLNYFTSRHESLRDLSFGNATYKDMAYVEEQCRLLAQQAKAAA